MKGVNKILGFIACLCFSIQGMQQVPKSKFTDPLEGKIPPSLIHLANSTNSTGLGSQQSSLNLSIQLGMQEASQQNKSIPYGVLIQCLTKHSAMAQRINIVMTPIIEKLAQALNNDIEQIVALKNLSIQIEENQTLNEIFNREFQQWADTLIEGLTHFNNGKLVFQPSNGNIRRKMAWMINRYMRLHLVQDQYDAMVKSFMENKIPCFDEIYEYNNSYFWRPHKWIGYSIDFLSTLPIAFRQIKMTERPEFKKLKEIRDLYVSGNRAGAQAQVDQNDTNHQSLWNSLESKYGSKSAQRDIEKLQFRQQELERQQDLERNRQIAQELNINVQSKIISALTSQNNAILIDVLNETKNSIYANAGRYKYEINAEVDYQIQASLNGLPLTNDPKEFTFQLGSVDFLS